MRSFRLAPRVVVALTILLVAACGHRSFVPQAPANTLPMYGADEGIQKTPAQKAADEQLIANAYKMGYTREEAARKSVDLGWSYFKKGDLQTAMRRFNQAWLLNPQNGDAIHGMAVTCAEMRCATAKIDRLFNQAIVQPEVRVAAFVDYGRFLWMTGRREQALSQLQHSLAIDPKAHDARRHMALIDEELGKKAEACALAKDAAANGDDLPPTEVMHLCS